MGSIMLYLPDEIIYKIRKEENMSRLVNHLLKEYYSSIVRLPEKLEEAKIKVDEAVTKVKDIENKLIEEQNRQEEQDKIIIASELERMNDDERKERRRAIQYEVMKDNYMISPESLSEVFEKYMTELDSGTIRNMIEFTAKEGILRKEKEKTDETIQ